MLISDNQYASNSNLNSNSGSNIIMSKSAHLKKQPQKKLYNTNVGPSSSFVNSTFSLDQPKIMYTGDAFQAGNFNSGNLKN